MGQIPAVEAQVVQAEAGTNVQFVQDQIMQPVPYSSFRTASTEGPDPTDRFYLYRPGQPPSSVQPGPTVLGSDTGDTGIGKCKQCGLLMLPSDTYCSACGTAR